MNVTTVSQLLHSSHTTSTSSV